jgi:hypothetical protein
MPFRRVDSLSDMLFHCIINPSCIACYGFVVIDCEFFCGKKRSFVLFRIKEYFLG